MKSYVPQIPGDEDEKVKDEEKPIPDIADAW